MRTFKLLFHQKSQQKQYSGEDLVLCPRDFPHLKENDVIEIYNPEENSPHLLLKIMKGSLREEFPQKDAVSIDQSIGAVFMFKAFVDVVVQKVDPKLVELDSIELTFKDQYLGRSDMWRLKKSLVGSCVYIGKKLEFCSSAIRCQVHELWTFGEKVTCGLITESTKIVFRSLTSMVYLFIQMSSEMWEFDIYGDLYFEKAVNGFLAELFAKWKQNGSNHEVTIVLFSRIFYNASSPEQFPEVMKECILTDYKGRYYEDFYRVVIQNEKYEDWRNTLINLRHVFVDYHDYLINFHKRNHPNLKIPRGKISTAAQGNFLEVLNMSLNVFEKHYIDRSFDRTGQISVVITPGVGVFEVDRELTNVTMQRVIDNGVGSDLVCVGEQPLHAVPLLKFHNKATRTNNVDDYSMPHWINLSFYSTNKRVGYASYIPRIKLPTSSSTFHALHSSSKHYVYKSPSIFGITSLRIDDTVWPTSMYDYDSYDENVFKTSGGQTSTKKRAKHIKRRTNASESDFSKIFLRQNSEPEMHQSISSDLGSLHNTSFVSSSMILPSMQPSSAITIPAHSKVKQNDLYSSSFGALNIELKPKFATNPNKSKWFSDDLAANKTNQILSPSNSSHGCSPKDKDNSKSLEIRRPSRSLINPFDPSHAVIKLTSNRRRWTHIFPRGPTGTLIQQHISSGCTRLDIVPEGESVTEPPVINGKKDSLVKSPSLSKQFPKDEAHSGDRMVTRLWGATGEQEWTPAMMTGVDWKSVTIPACLPLTTDYFPDDRSLKVDYLVSADYSLLPDDVNADYSSQRAVYRKPLTTKEVYAELVSQRLAQGFQNVIRCKSEKPVLKTQLSSSIIRTNSSLQQEFEEEHFMSIGRIFHRISLSESTIKVTLYRPRHPYPSINIPYKYRFQAPNNHSYEVSCGDFSTEKLENYNWNYLDHYICTRGDKDFPVNESLKYWRFRILVLPTNPTALKKIMGDSVPCNVFLPFSLDDKKALIQDFLKFIETCINRIRRPNNSVPKGASRGPSGSSQSSTGPTSGFRERVNSNQLSERPRMKSGSRINEKQRQDSGNGRLSPFEANFDSKSSVASPLLEPLLDSQMGSNFRNSDASTDTTPVDFKLKADSTYTDVITAMRSQKTGFSFIKSSDLPLWTFVSYDAVTWLFNHMEEMNTERQAIDFFSGMLSKKLILHASKDPCHRFVNGFYLYYIVTNDAEEPLSLEGLVPQWDSATFHNDWMEVEVPVPDTPCQQTDFASDSVDTACHKGCVSILNSSTTFKDVYADVDVSKKSDRQEWGHVRYQSVYYPEEAYEITIQWIQATGAIITDLVQGWLRKAQQCNLQLIPVPTDLFALSHSNNSDPLRGPISIHLNSQSLLENFAPLNEGFCEQEWMDRMLYFQHNVALQFGFLRIPKQSNSRRLEISELHYVHTTGNMFIMIELSQPILQAGYYWSWNYMVSKKWKTNLTPVLADDPFMFKVLMDFKAFCDNEDGRLINAWNDTFDPSKNKCNDFTRSSSRTDVSA